MDDALVLPEELFPPGTTVFLNAFNVQPQSPVGEKSDIISMNVGKNVGVKVCVCSPSAERGAVGDHVDAQRPAVTWELNGTRQRAVEKTHEK